MGWLPVRGVRRLASGALFAVALLGAGPGRAEDGVSFGIVPQQSAVELARRWAPLLLYLSEKSGLRLEFTTAKDIPTFERHLAAGEYDVAYMNPYHYTVFHRRPGYAVFAKEKDTRLQGIVVVRKDSPYRRLEDLAGQTLAFPAPAAFAASVLPRAELRRAGVSFTPKYVASHDSVYLAVAKGLYPAGGGVTRTFAAADPAAREELRVLWTTPEYAAHAFAAHPRLPAATVDRLRRAMFAATADPAVRPLLDALKFKGFEAAADGEWDGVRGLGIDLLEELVRE